MIRLFFQQTIYNYDLDQFLASDLDKFIYEESNEFYINLNELFSENDLTECEDPFKLDINLSNINTDEIKLNNENINSVYMENSHITKLHLDTATCFCIKKSKIQEIKINKIRDFIIIESNINTVCVEDANSVTYVDPAINTSIFKKIKSFHMRDINRQYMEILSSYNFMQLTISEKINIKTSLPGRFSYDGNMELLDIETLTDLNKLIKEGKDVKIDKDELTKLLIEHRSKYTKSANN